MFKETVSTRKFNKKYTRFRRKAFNRLKHKTLWTIYSNVFKFWSHDFLINKSVTQVQFLENILPFTFNFFNWNIVKQKNLSLFLNFNFLFLNNCFIDLKKKFNFYSFNKSNNLNPLTVVISKKNKNFSASIGYSLNNQNDNEGTPIFLLKKNNLFCEPISDKAPLKLFLDLQLNLVYLNLKNYYNFLIFLIFVNNCNYNPVVSCINVGKKTENPIFLKVSKI